MIDVNPLVDGGGINFLKQNNIEIITGILEEKARKLNESYIKFIREKIPFVTMKLAVTLDGKIADAKGKSKWITGTETRKYIHLLRSFSDAVMVGVGTVLADDPLLTVRDVKGSDPLRVIVDSQLRTPVEANIVSDNNVIIAITDNADQKKAALFAERNIEVWEFESMGGRVPLMGVLIKLGERNITSLLCEGGGTLAASLINEKLVDKVIFTVAPKILGSGYNALNGLSIENLDDALCLKDIEVETIGDDIIITGYPAYK